MTIKLEKTYELKGFLGTRKRRKEATDEEGFRAELFKMLQTEAVNFKCHGARTLSLVLSKETNPDFFNCNFRGVLYMDVGEKVVSVAWTDDRKPYNSEKAYIQDLLNHLYRKAKAFQKFYFKTSKFMIQAI